MIPFRTHIAQLCGEHAIIADKQLKRVDVFALPHKRVIAISDLGDPVAYFSALHEVGHVVLGHVRLKDDNGTPKVIDQETEAWEWALAHAKFKPTRDVCKAISNFIGSYLAAQETTPRPDHPVWALKNVVEPTMMVAGPKGRLP